MDSHSFLFQSFIFLGAAVIMLPLAKRLRLGSVLGYLIAGIAIGPFVFGFIDSEGQDIMHFAEFGVVMMLFIIGLELEPALLWKMRKKILGLGSLQVVVTGLVIGLITFLAGMNWMESFVIGSILSLSSTAIVLQTLNEKDLLRTSGGQASFSVLLFQDIAVIPMLAIFPLLAPPGSETVADGHNNSSWISSHSASVQGLIIFGSIMLIIVGGRYLLRPLLREIARTNLREAFTATALFLVVAIAVWMTYLGLSAALGTFLAGVVLANSEFKHELESDIEPFKGLLLGLFFIAVGASIDFKLVFQQPLLIMGIVAALVAVKGIVLWVLASFFMLRRRQRLLFAAALSQVGEFAFVLLSLSQAQSLLPPTVVQLLIAAVAISMALTPFIMLIYDHLPVGGQKKNEERHDDIEERNPVIIAGFGHFGNTIGRFLRANGVSATYLDIDAERVALLRKMGFNVYYGDASRHDMLLSAGADVAKIIVIALDNKEKRMEMVHTIKKHFPHLKIFMRASNRYDAYQHIEAGVTHIYRESIDTSLRLGADVLASFGVRRYLVQRSARQFFRYDEATVAKLSTIKDHSAYIHAANEFTREIEALIAVEKKVTFTPSDKDWDNTTLKQEYGANGQRTPEPGD